MRIAITGARGLVGSALARRYPHAVALTHRELDITDREAVSRVVRDFDLAFNCAVIGVDDCESDSALARAVNVDGPANLAEFAKKLVHFSTNYVFAGDEERFYDVDDEVKPVNVYGATKAEGERAVLARDGLVIRTSWVYGRGKDNFLSTVGARLQRGERVRAIGDVFASCTYVEDLADAVVKLLGERLEARRERRRPLLRRLRARARRRSVTDRRRQRARRHACPAPTLHPASQLVTDA